MLNLKEELNTDLDAGVVVSLASAGWRGLLRHHMSAMKKQTNSYLNNTEKEENVEKIMSWSY